MEKFPIELQSRPALAERLLELWEVTGDERLHRLASGRRPDPEPGDTPLTEKEYSDWVSTTLMDCFHRTGERKVFGLLFELNQQIFLAAIQAKLRRCSAQVDAQDVLQDVFLNIYRYPHRFLVERSDSFRSWGHRIVRNALLKQLKARARDLRIASIDTDESSGQWQDPRARAPSAAAETAESAEAVNRAYVLYLTMYMAQFERLTDKERQALTLVEVDGATYKAAAAELGVRLENVKMVIFRGRRKIFRGMAAALTGLGASPEVAEQTFRAPAAGAPRRTTVLPRAIPTRAHAAQVRSISAPRTDAHLPANTVCDVATDA